MLRHYASKAPLAPDAPFSLLFTQLRAPVERIKAKQQL